MVIYKEAHVINSQVVHKQTVLKQTQGFKRNEAYPTGGAHFPLSNWQRKKKMRVLCAGEDTIKWAVLYPAGGW